MFYLIETEDSLLGLLALIRTRYSVEEKAVRPTRFTYLDTFDWRVWRNDAVVEYREDKQQKMLIWRSVKDGQAIQEIPVDKQPDFLSEVPEWLRPGKLQSTMKVRAFITQTSSRGQVRSLEICGKKDKVVARLEIITESLVKANNRKGEALPLRMVIKPVTGYQKDLNVILSIIEEFKIEGYGKDPFVRLLELSGREPCDYSNKPYAHMTMDMRADMVSKDILLQLLNIMQKNEEGIRKDIDTEFLHDFRVSIRRSRSLLSQAGGIFPKTTLQRFYNDLSWLGTITGPLRDYDVWLLAFDSYQQDLPIKLRSYLEPLREWLQVERAKALKDVIKVLDSKRYERFTKAWRVYLECAVPKRTVLPDANRSILAVSGNRIWKTYRKLRKRGDVIDGKSPPTMLHDLRKTGKKLRYLLEFFRTLYSGRSLNPMIKRLEKLQDYLGTYQDYDVQQASLVHFMQGMKEAGKLCDTTQNAMQYLIDDMAKREKKHRKNFGCYYHIFTHGKTNSTFKKLFKVEAQS
ncbi:MAG: CHAD domain-containing protein [Gammaproteobacteria bacterium]|nr:MAG: CHAD domain-containing protein [Gammaproteobacteria bacterium]